MKKNAKTFKTANIKGKQYVEVKERLLYLSNSFDGEYSINTEYEYFEARKMWVVKATLTLVQDGIQNTYTGLAQEIESESFKDVNHTSALENCETSAVGRACAMAGIGIETSIASADEVNKAINRQEVNAKQAADLLATALQEVLECTDKECTANVWNKYPNLKDVEQFKQAVATKGKGFTQAEVKAPEQPKNEPEQNFEEAQLDHNARQAEAVELATEKQMQLVQNLYGSHHVHDAVWDGEVLTKQDAKVLIDVMTDLIAKGTEIEKNTPATAEMVEDIEIKLENACFTEDERNKGMEKLKKGYSIAQARNVLSKLDSHIQERFTIQGK